MADLRWNPVSVNFNDASALMRNAGDSISKAGTVFGELRKSILDEEQRAIENAYNERKMAESIRQFDERLGFDKSKWNDEYALDQEKLKELAAYHQGSLKNQAAGVEIQRLDYALRKAKADEELRQKRELANLNADWLTAKTLDAQDVAAYGVKKQNEIGDYVQQRQLAQNAMTDIQAKLANNPDAETASILQQQLADAKKQYDDASAVEQTWTQWNPEPQLRHKYGNTAEESLAYMAEAGRRGVSLGLSDTPLAPFVTASLQANANAEAKKIEAASKQEEIRLKGQMDRLAKGAELSANAKTYRELFKDADVDPDFLPDINDWDSAIKQYATKHHLRTPSKKEIFDWWMGANNVHSNILDAFARWRATPSFGFNRTGSVKSYKDIELHSSNPAKALYNYLEALKK